VGGHECGVESRGGGREGTFGGPAFWMDFIPFWDKGRRKGKASCEQVGGKARGCIAWMEEGEDRHTWAVGVMASSRGGVSFGVGRPLSYDIGGSRIEVLRAPSGVVVGLLMTIFGLLLLGMIGPAL
jgi:hypothetical protein